MLDLFITIVVGGACGLAGWKAWSWAAEKYRQSLAPVIDHLESTKQQIDQFLGGFEYARRSQTDALVRGCLAALRPAKTVAWKAFASRDQRALAASIQNFVMRAHDLANSANQGFIDLELERCKQLFDTIESQPLTALQRRACVVCEDNNLVLAGAGTGKTSTMTGRAGYLVAGQRAAASEVLMLAYARKAAEEMQERQDNRLRPWLGESLPKVKTFHALGLEIVGKVEGARPTVTPMAQDMTKFARFIDERIDALCGNSSYRSKVIQYFGSERYPYRSHFDFSSSAEYLEYVRTHEIRTLRGDVVKSFEECVIANFLSAHGIRYEYETPYIINTSGPDYRRYQPDFFLPDYRIYIEHFAINRQGKAPKHFTDAQGYVEGINWKRGLHSENGTKLIETYSYLRREGKLESHLATELARAGVPLRKKSDEELLGELRDLTLISDLAELLGDFLSRFKDSGLSLTDVLQSADAHRDASRLNLLLQLATPVLNAYEQHLQREKQVDFADMIRRATSYVESGAYKSPYTHIMVDEFQDISKNRADLILALKRQRPDASLFAVGDDWQSIYRFAGSDIGYTRNFAETFGPTATTALDLTFRFNDRINQVASTFVLRNDSQIVRQLNSASQTSLPSVSMVRVLRDQVGLELVLEAISTKPNAGHGHRPAVLVLGRYNYHMEALRSAFRSERYPLLDLSFMTVHAAKGKEADYVVIVGLSKGKNGFPCEKPTDGLIEFVLPEKELFLHAEERRLFYVALTRARHRAYLVYNPNEQSTFVSELIREPAYEVCRDEFDTHEGVILQEHPLVACPSCESGHLHIKGSQHGQFVGCNNFPYCKYTERPCPQCRHIMIRDRTKRRCTNNQCNAVVPLCQRCGGDMVRRTGPHGAFWGCSNYRHKAAFICTNTATMA